MVGDQRTIFAQPDLNAAQTQVLEVRGMLDKRCPNAAVVLAAGTDDVLS